jgi:hypothetical protein
MHWRVMKMHGWAREVPEHVFLLTFGAAGLRGIEVHVVFKDSPAFLTSKIILRHFLAFLLQ